MIRALALACAALAACSTPDYGNGQLKCATSSPRCPDGYYCAGDDHCWKRNSGPTDAGLDLSVADGAPPDLANDLASDLSGADLSTPPDLTPPVDLVSSDLLPSQCNGLSVLLCEGFESATLASTWIVEQHGGTDAIEPNPYRGAHSLHLHTDATSVQEPYSGIRNSTIFPLSGTVYVRVWAYFPSSQPMTFDQFINFTDAASGGTSYSIENDWPSNNDYGSTQFNQSTSVKVPRDRWTCLQYQIPQPAGTGPIRLFVDGNEVTDAALQAATVTTMTKIHFGLDFLNGGNPVGAGDVWIDEIIVDNKATTCAE